MESEATKHTDRPIDYVVVGAGPAGVQLAYFFERDERDYLVLEGDRVGSFFSRLPRHRRLISNNKVHTGFSDPEKNLRWDWNSLLSEEFSPTFTDYTDDYFPHADTLVQYLQDFRDRFGLKVETGAHVESIGREESGLFRLRITDGRTFRARRVVVATGHTVPHTPDVPGIHLCEQYAEVSTDPADFTGQRVLVVGKGNSGMEVAENIFQKAASIHVLSPTPVRLAWTTHHVSDVRAVYNNILDSYQLKMQNTVLDAELVSIRSAAGGQKEVTFRYTHAQGQTWKLTVDRIVLCCGFRFDFSVFDHTCVPERTATGRWPALTSSWESVNVPHLYFAGTLMQSRDYKQSFSGFIHGFRYAIRLMNGVLAHRYHAVPHHRETLSRRAEELTEKVIDRASNASSIFQLPAFLADVYVLDDADGRVRFHADLTVDYALDAPFLRDRALLVVTLEYGHLPPGADPFNVPRDPADGTTNQFIHPVLRLYRGGTLLATHHVPEDLENDWGKAMYVEPCRDVLRAMLAMTAGHFAGADPVRP